MMNFNELATPALIAFYNQYAERPVRRFSDRPTAIKRCSELWESLQAASHSKVLNQRPPARKTEQPLKREAMRDTLKLSREIRCLDTMETWPNAHQMWKQHPDWMSSGQQDRLTRKLYEAAKRGEAAVAEMNGRRYQLTAKELRNVA
jgi:hypothetical protein